MLLAERQAKNVEHDTGDEAAEKAIANESNVESLEAMQEQDSVVTEDVEEAANDEAEDDAVEEAVWETIIFTITVMDNCFNCWG